MKTKWLLILLIVSVVLFVSGCNQSTPSEENEPIVLAKDLPSFSTEDLSGTTVTEEILSEHSVNMIYLWGTG